MGLYKYLKQSWRQPKHGLGSLWKDRLIKWRKEPTTLRLDHPTRLDKAHALGYKSKKGIFVVRQKVVKGTHVREWKGGRKSANSRVYLALRKSYQLIAEERTNEKYVNCEVLNSYYVGEDGKSFWFEVILVDRSAPEVLNDLHLRWIHDQRGRVYRGLTSAGRKVRGLRNKGKGSEKTRPSRRAHNRLS